MSILAIAAWNQANSDYRGLHATFEDAGKLAQDALAIAPQAKSHPDYSASILRANTIAGVAALKAGDKAAAVRYLNASLDAPISDELKYPIIDARPWPNNWRSPYILLAALYKAGERGTLADYLDRYAKVSVTDHDRCQQLASQIRAGQTPRWPYAAEQPQ
jgi:hypothetical protein